MEASKPTFLTIPPEIREEIYRLILHPAANRVYHEDEYITYNYAPALVLFRTNRQIYNESQKIFRDLNIFVRVETPWPEAQKHVATEGHVPIVIPADRVVKFDYHRLSVGIDAPDHPMLEWETQRFTLLVDDLPKFTRMWFYADLTYPNLNEHLRLTLRLLDPSTPAHEEKRIPKSLQRKLLLPFGDVKNLHSTVADAGGDDDDDVLQPFASVMSELRALQSQPPPTPEACLAECTRLKSEGNSALTSGDFFRALELYDRAWLAIHIVVKGRLRHIHADKFFARNLTSPPYANKNGQTERLLLRVQLVANTCQVYLKLEDYESCRFWGFRTIGMLREAMGADPRQELRPEDEAILQFPAASQMGKIYYRTAVAAKALGDEGEARKLLRVARLYLPEDPIVAREIEATALRLG